MTNLSRGEPSNRSAPSQNRTNITSASAKLSFSFADPFAAALQATRTPMVITDPNEADNPIVFANDAFCTLTGYSRSEVLGRNCRFLQGPETDPMTVIKIFAAIEADEPIETDIVNYRKDGEAFWNRISIAPIYDSNGSVAYFVGSQMDVTPQIEQMAVLQNRMGAVFEYADSLAVRNRELAEENRALEAESENQALLEAGLRQCQKMEVVGQLTSGIAHDFNNLLVGIIGSLELLDRFINTGRADKAEHFLAAALASAKSAASLTNRLLTFARYQPAKSECIDVNQVIRGMKDLLNHTLRPSIEMKIVLADGLKPVQCDANQLENAILNLAINARDAMPYGGLLTVSTKTILIEEDEVVLATGAVTPGQYISVAVSDNGIGMTSEVIANAFKPFYTTKPVGQGTGLGLSMVHTFIKQSAGQCCIQSMPGSGTTFTLYLPVDSDWAGYGVTEICAAAGQAGQSRAC